MYLCMCVYFMYRILSVAIWRNNKRQTIGCLFKYSVFERHNKIISEKHADDKSSENDLIRLLKHLAV